MALEKSETMPAGGTATNAYHRITLTKGDPKGKFLALVSSYYDAAARNAGNPPYTERWFELTPEVAAVDTNVLKDLYAKVKAEAAQHDGFFNSGTTDV